MCKLKIEVVYNNGNSVYKNVVGMRKAERFY